MGSRGQNHNTSYQRLSRNRKEKVDPQKPPKQSSLDELDDMDNEDNGEEIQEDTDELEQEAQTDVYDEYDIRNFNRDELPFEVIDQSDFRGVYHYQLLDKLGRKWRIISRDEALEALNNNDVDEALRFNLERPTYIWVKDGKAMQLFVEGMNREEFFAALNIKIDKLDNTTTLAKRLSRLLRPQSIAGHFKADTIKIAHDLPDLGDISAKAVWDGGGVVNRQMLLRMIGQLPKDKDLDDKSRRKLIHELRTANRVEFTVMTADGQLKGHAMVIETNDALWQQIQNRTKQFDPRIANLSDELRQDFGEAADMLSAVANENRRLKKQNRKDERRDLNVELEDLLSRLSQKHAQTFNETYGQGTYGRGLDIELEIALRNAAGMRLPDDLISRLEKQNRMKSLDDLKPADFLVPKDYKTHLKMTGEERFVSFKAPKTSAQMHLDIQSNINLQNFWSVEQKQQWLRDESEIFLHAIRTGDMGPALTRIDPSISPEKLENWPLVEYGAGGGDPNWSDSIVRQLANQHLRSLKQMEIQEAKLDENNKWVRPDDKLSLPIPGGRYYVFPAPIARAASKNIHVAPGEAHVDKASGTVWVNEDDWGKMKDAAPDRADSSGTVKPWGLARILGGMDNDDALWVQEFLDEADGEGAKPKLLIWRSPNAPGEYAVLNSHQNSDPIPWTRINEEGKLEEHRYTHADTRKLFPRIDHALEEGYIIIETENISKAEPNDAKTAEKITGDIYLDAMYEAAKRAHKNGRTLGSYCNLMMIEMASQDISPANPLRLPCATEDVIDAVQKTGADTSKVQEFVDNRRKAMMTYPKQPIPKRLQHRLEFKNMTAAFTDGNDTLSQTDRMVLQHIREFGNARDNLRAKARPPHAVIEHGLSDPDAFEVGKKLNSIWHDKFKEKSDAAAKQNRGTLTDSEWGEVNQAVIDVLNEYSGSPQKQGKILAGAWTSAFLNQKSDSAIWALGPKKQDGTNSTGTFHMTVKMLQELGMVDQPDWHEEDGLRYLPNPEPTTYREGHRRDYEAIEVRGAGLNLMDNLAVDYINQAQSESVVREYGLQAAKQHLKEKGSRDLYTKLPKTLEKVVRERAHKLLRNRLREAKTGEHEIHVTLHESLDKSGQPRLDVVTESGFRLGVISKETQKQYQAGQRIEIRLGIESDGSILGTAYKLGSGDRVDIQDIEE
jgi:hypothetical protein